MVQIILKLYDDAGLRQVGVISLCLIIFIGKAKNHKIMQNYLKEFPTVSDYEDYASDAEHFIKPNVSAISGSATVFYTAETPEQESNEPEQGE